MTRIRWTTTAADDFADVVERIRADNPSAAHRVAQTIHKGIALLRAQPHRGRVGLAENTRELIFPPWPYIVVYELIGDQVQVLRIRHASQDWPQPRVNARTGGSVTATFPSTLYNLVR